MPMNLPLRIIVQKPPAGLDYGLQKGSGSQYETVQIQRADGGDVEFCLEVELKNDSQAKGEPRFGGPFIQGPPLGRFIYIDIGQYAGQAGAFGGRIKIAFSDISWDIIGRLTADSLALLETTIPGTGKNGAPACATVKPFDGWRLKSR